MSTIPLYAIILLTIFAGFIIGSRWERFRPERPAQEPHNALRALMLACGEDSRKHPDACQELSSLVAAGYEVKFVGGTRAGFMRIDILNPRSKSLT